MCQWQEKHVTFIHDGEQVTLQGVRPKEQPAITAVEPEELRKMIAVNDVWAMVMMDARSVDAKRHPSSPTPISDLLGEFANVFAAPKGLPPHRQYDHAVTLVDGAPRQTHGHTNTRHFKRMKSRSRFSRCWTWE